MNIPFLDLKVKDDLLLAEIHEAIHKVIETGKFIGGPALREFEDDFADYCGVKHAVGVGSGTDALWLALMAAGVGPGDEVVTTPMTFVATVEAIIRIGAKPVFVDIRPSDYNLDPEKLEAVVTPRTKVIIPVHLFGQTAEMTPIIKVAEKYGIQIIEDAAHAHGASYHGKRAGSLGEIGCFSFYPGKNLGAFGEGGAITTDDDVIADFIRSYSNHGQKKKNHHETFGWNCRLDTLQAVVLKIKLRHLDEAIEGRARNAGRYDRGLADMDEVTLPTVLENRSHVYHLYSVRLPQRKRLLDKFKEQGIGWGIHYPVPVHLQAGYANLGYQRGDFPVSEVCAKEFVSLPMYPSLTDQQIDQVVEVVRDSVACGMVA